MPEKKPSRRIKPVVEEVDANPTPAPSPVEPQAAPPAPVAETPAVTEPQPQADPTPVVKEVTEVTPTADEQAKKALSELETVHTEHKKSKRGINLKLLFTLTVLVALVVGFVAGGLYVYTQGISALNGQQEDEQPMGTGDPTGEEEQTPEPTATPEPVDVSEYTISVLNGSGKIGEAGTVENILDEAGFTVGNTGNASRYNYTNSVIQAQEDVPEEVITQLQKALAESYSVEIGDTLPASSTYDIVVTVGSTTN